MESHGVKSLAATEDIYDDINLLKCALTHSSYANEKKIEDYKDELSSQIKDITDGIFYINIIP